MRALPLAILAAIETAFLLAYFIVTRTALSLPDWLASFSWEPVTGDFAFRYFAGVAGMSVLSLAVYQTWLLACWGAGAFLLKCIGWKGQGGQRALAAVGLGLGLLSLIVFFLGACGLMSRPAVLAVGAGLLALGWEPMQNVPKHLDIGSPPMTLPMAVAALLCAGGLFFHLCGALLPPLSFDEMNYQLSLPNLYIINGGFVPTPFNHLSFLPKNMSMLFVAGLLSGGAATAKLFSWGMGALAAAALFTFPRKRLGGAAAFWGTAIFLLAPVVANQFRVAGADLGTAFYELLAVFLLLDWIDGAQPCTLVLSSVFWGLALGCKYTALPGFLACAAVLGYFARKKKEPALRTAALYALPALALWSPWLIKNWVDCGNPVAPLLSTVITSRNFFFAGAYHPMVDYTAGLGIENYFPIRGLLDFARLPWDLTVNHNDFNHDLGPVFLMCFPLWAFVKKDRLPGWIKVLVFLCSLYWAGWLLAGARMSRYFVAGLGLTSLLCGWLLAEATSRLTRLSDRDVSVQDLGRETSRLTSARAWALLAPFLLAMTQQTLRAVWIQNLYKKPWGYLSGRCSREDYLHALQPDSPINAELFINDRLPQDARILVFNEFRTFYLRRDFLASTPWDHDYWHELVRLSRDPDDFYARVKALRITHILANDNYVQHQVGVPLLHPNWWTNEDRAKGLLFLKACAWTVFRDDGVWVARFYPPRELPRAKMPPGKV